MKVNPPTVAGSWGDSVLHRPRLTAKAYRALGYRVPKFVDDREVITVRVQATPTDLREMEA